MSQGAVVQDIDFSSLSRLSPRNVHFVNIQASDYPSGKIALDVIMHGHQQVQ